MKQTKEKIDFNEFVDEATRHAHSELLKEGGKGLRTAIFLYISSAIQHEKYGSFRRG